MKTILVPTDLSPSAGALQVAVDLAHTYGAEVLLMHYLPFSIASAGTAGGVMIMTNYFDEQEDDAKPALQRLIDNPAYQGVEGVVTTLVAIRSAGDLYTAMTKPGCRGERVEAGGQRV